MGIPQAFGGEGRPQLCTERPKGTPPLWMPQLCGRGDELWGRQAPGHFLACGAPASL